MKKLLTLVTTLLPAGPAAKAGQSAETTSSIGEWSTERGRATSTLLEYVQVALSSLLHNIISKTTPNGGDILEVGCGEIPLVLSYKHGLTQKEHIKTGKIGDEHPIKWTAIEPNPDLARSATKRCKDIPGIQIITKDLLHTQEPPQDLVLLHNVADVLLGDISSPEVFDNYIQQVANLLKPGGHMVVLQTYPIYLGAIDRMADEYMKKGQALFAWAPMEQQDTLQSPRMQFCAIALKDLAKFNTPEFVSYLMHSAADLLESSGHGNIILTTNTLLEKYRNPSSFDYSIAEILVTEITANHGLHEITFVLKDFLEVNKIPYEVIALEDYARKTIKKSAKSAGLKLAFKDTFAREKVVYEGPSADGVHRILFDGNVAKGASSHAPDTAETIAYRAIVMRKPELEADARSTLKAKPAPSAEAAGEANAGAAAEASAGSAEEPLTEAVA